MDDRVAYWSTTGLAAGRLALGVTALLRPQLPVRPWVGSVVAETPTGRMLARALGGRDIALAVGALRAGADSARPWILAGALADATDTVVTCVHWPALPKVGRVLVTAAAAGAAIVGIAGARALSGPDPVEQRGVEGQ